MSDEPPRAALDDEMHSQVRKKHEKKQRPIKTKWLISDDYAELEATDLTLVVRTGDHTVSNLAAFRSISAFS